MTLRDLISLSDSDESIYVFARPYFLSFLPWFSLGLALVVAGLLFVFFVVRIFPDFIATDFQFDVFVIMTSAYFLLTLPFITVGFIDYYYDILVVTDRRLLDVDQNSLFSRNINELALEQIEDVSSPTTGILNTFLDFGDVNIQTAGAKDKFVFKGVLHPREITEIILDLADQAKQRIERGAQPLSPHGTIKAVIENRVYTDTAPLLAMGAMLPHVIHKPGPNPVVTTPLPAPASSSPPADDALDIVIDNPDR